MKFSLFQIKVRTQYYFQIVKKKMLNEKAFKIEIPSNYILFNNTPLFITPILPILHILFK